MGRTSSKSGTEQGSNSKGPDSSYFWLVSHIASAITNVISRVVVFAKREDTYI